MVKYEYRSFPLGNNSAAHHLTLNPLGKEGWQLAAISNNTAYLIRPVPQEPDVRTQMDATKHRVRTLKQQTKDTQKSPALKSVEQLVRDVLEASVEDGLVREQPHTYGGHPPQEYSSGELVRPANMIHFHIQAALTRQETRLRAEFDKELDSIREFIPKELQVIVKEGGDPEDHIGSLSVSVAKMAETLKQYTKEIKE